MGDKAGKLIAWLDKKERTSRCVARLELASGEEVKDPQDLAVAFAQHYETVYTPSVKASIEENLAFIKDIRLPTLDAQQLCTLEAPLTADEITAAIKGLQPGKALGPTGIPVEFYKRKADALGPHLVKMYEDSLKKGILPRDQRIASLVTILKPDKPPQECTSYRPISLLNAEAKILAKALASRLQPLLTTLVHPDQSGFMPGRNTAMNLRRLHGVMARIPTIQEEAVILSLDASMAFDRVE